jgi:hypothetical protein
VTRVKGRLGLGTRLTIARREHALAIELMTGATNAIEITMHPDARRSQSTS